MANKKEKKTVVEAPVQEEETSQEPQVADILPQPVPVSFKVSQVTDGQGGSAIQMEVFTPTGRQVLFLAPKFAQSLSEALYKMSQASTPAVEDEG